MPGIPSKTKGTPFDRTGISQSFKTRVAAQFNWLKRSTLGIRASVHLHKNLLWMMAQPEWKTELTQEQRDFIIIRMAEGVYYLDKAAAHVVAIVEEYNKLPKVPSPKRERYKAQRAAKSAVRQLEKVG